MAAASRLASKKRPYRLTVRTSGSHPGNRGSIPRKVMAQKAPVLGAFLCTWPYEHTVWETVCVGIEDLAR